MPCGQTPRRCRSGAGGKEFRGALRSQQITGAYFHHFMVTHMPLTDPGSLTEMRYLDLMAYFLEVNGYPSGSSPLTADDRVLKCIRIGPQSWGRSPTENQHDLLILMA